MRLWDSTAFVVIGGACLFFAFVLNTFILAIPPVVCLWLAVTARPKNAPPLAEVKNILRLLRFSGITFVVVMALFALLFLL